MSSSRPTRKCKKNAITKKPSASMYLGYVDDNETVEMITQKFALLDEFFKSNSKKTNESEPLTEEEMEQVFNITSTFSISELNNGSSLFDESSESDDEDSDLVYYEEESDFFSDYSNSDESLPDSSDEIGYFNKEDSLDSTDNSASKRYANSNSMMNDEYISDLDDDYSNKLDSKQKVKKKKKTRQVDPCAPQFIRLPPQIPMNRKMARVISPFTGYNEYPFVPDSLYIETDICSFDLESLGRKFVGVLMDVPWLLPEHTNTTHRMTTDRLYNLRIDKIVDNGLVFVWVEKEVISSCVKLFSKWNFTYVENLVWIKQNIDLTVAKQPYYIFNKSKTSLLIFRKGDKLNLRHQRNPDVVFDIIKRGKYLTEDKPLSVYKIIETILPEGNYKSDKEPGGFLELYQDGAKKGLKEKVG